MRSTGRFAVYKPRPKAARTRQPEEADVRIAPAVARDVDAIARLTLEREGGTYETARVRAHAWLTGTSGGKNLFLVARVGRSVAGYARAGFVRATKGDYADVPEGWYLGGIIVAQAFRRRGIGTMLTRRRIEWLAGRGAREIYYFVNSLNRASIDLHTPFGFTEVRRDFRFPGVTFSGGGTGVLFRAPLAAIKQDRRMRYLDFRDAIRRELARNRAGLTWAQLRDRLRLPYARPCPAWTAQLEKEIGLTRRPGNGAGRAYVWAITRA